MEKIFRGARLWSSSPPECSGTPPCPAPREGVKGGGPLPFGAQSPGRRARVFGGCEAARPPGHEGAPKVGEGIRGGGRRGGGGGEQLP